jgi:hypothetical protein
MSEPQDLTFLFDVDNTLLDNDESNCNSHSVSRVAAASAVPTL